MYQTPGHEPPLGMVWLLCSGIFFGGWGESVHSRQLKALHSTSRKIRLLCIAKYTQSVDGMTISPHSVSDEGMTNVLDDVYLRMNAQYSGNGSREL